MRASRPTPTPTLAAFLAAPRPPKPRALTVAPVDVRVVGGATFAVDRDAARVVADALNAFFVDVAVDLADAAAPVAAPARRTRAMHDDLAEYTRDVNGYVGPQVDAGLVLRGRPADCVALVGADLYSPRAPWNFLWGWSASFARGAAKTASGPVVVSLARGGRGPPGDDAWAGRPGLARLVTHHVRTVAAAKFGVRQCRLARCLFNGVGCDEELAATPWEPCPACLRKLAAAGVCRDARHLLSSVLAFLETHAALRDEAAFLACRLRHMGAA